MANNHAESDSVQANTLAQLPEWKDVCTTFRKAFGSSGSEDLLSMILTEYVQVSFCSAELKEFVDC